MDRESLTKKRFLASLALLLVAVSLSSAEELPARPVATDSAAEAIEAYQALKTEFEEMKRRLAEAEAKLARLAPPDAQKPGGPEPIAAPEGAAASPAEQKSEGAAPAARTPTFDPAVVSAGQAAFDRSCTKCHDAARSLERTKDLAGWRATVQRMANRRGADIAADDIEPIAVYLASRAAPASGAPGERIAEGAGGDRSSFSVFATLSPLWRGGNADVQNPGFFPETWVGAAWQGKVVSARVTACTTCHGVQEAVGPQRIELVEAAVRVDLSACLDKCWHGMKGGIDAGRFVVPFGAFSSQVNPGLFRTVSKPLIFNMGQRVFANDLGQPVLPMPYVDQGVNLNLDVPLGNFGLGPITATMDAYVVNGLTGFDEGVFFEFSRDLADNNHDVAGGGRVTIGGPNVRLGASVMNGRFNDPTLKFGTHTGLDYTIYGFDAQAHYKDLFRFQCEYARRDNDRLNDFGSGPEVFTETVDGYYFEAEVRPWQKCCVSLLGRYDQMRRHSLLPAPFSTLPTGLYDIQRLTGGINFTLWRQSLLMLDYERWFIHDPLRSVDVFGVRYAVTF
jgi:hypothetical protein